MFKLASITLCFGVLTQAQPAPIPDTPTLLKELQAQQRKMDQIRENYTFHRIRQVDDVDQNGSVKKTTTEEREIFFVNGRQIGRLVKKNGVNLSVSEDKSEQARVKKLVEQFMKPTPPRAGFSSLTSTILAVAKVSNPRRISLNSRDTLTFDFVGDPKARAQDTVQNIAKKVRGTLWVDEADRQVARLEVTFDDNFRMGGGLLASIQKGSNVKVEQAPVGQGLWLESSNEQHVAARIVVKSLRQNIHVKNFDFKRFDVGMVQQVSPPR